MNFATVNLSGNAAKTPTRKPLLAPLVQNARVISIEDLNDADGVVDSEIAAREFRNLAVELNTSLGEVDYVIDIGSSNLRETLQHLRTLKTTRELIDYWIVPCCPTLKQRTDTVATIQALMEMGVPSNRIRVLPSAVADIQEADAIFKPLRDVAPEVGYEVCAVPVLFSDVYQLLKDRKATVFDVAADTTDFNAQARQHRGDIKRLEDIGKAMVVRDMAEVACVNLRAVFASLNLETRQ